MPEYQPQWVAPKKTANATRDGTDSTDSLPPHPEPVSAVSAALGPIRASFPSRRHANAGLTPDAAAALGLDPSLLWVHVSTAPSPRPARMEAWTSTRAVPA
jgi:hypothetical protein